MPRDYRIVARIKNNRLWAAIEREFPDVKSQAEAARRLEVSAGELGELLNMTVFPYSRRYETWWTVAEKVAAGLRETPEYLFDPELYGTKPGPIVVEVDRKALAEHLRVLALPAPLPSEAVEAKERRGALFGTLSTLRPREAKVLRLRFGLDDGVERTLDEIGQQIQVQAERVRQIENTALRKLRHPMRSRPLREHLA